MQRMMKLAPSEHENMTNVINRDDWLLADDLNPLSSEYEAGTRFFLFCGVGLNPH
jgi:hypothetical protein